MKKLIPIRKVGGAIVKKYFGGETLTSIKQNEML